jgi:stalled ribosome rescue protein Dom34
LSEHFHAVVWIDHHEARVFHFNADEAQREQVHPLHPVRHIHHKANSIGSGHSAEDQKFFSAVVEAVGTAGAVLITGPASAKHELMKHIERHPSQLHARVAGVETLDHPTDGELLAHARQFFRAADRMAPQRT